MRSMEDDGAMRGTYDSLCNRNDVSENEIGNQSIRNAPFSSADGSEVHTLFRRQVDHNEPVRTGRSGVHDCALLTMRMEGVEVAYERESMSPGRLRERRW